MNRETAHNVLASEAGKFNTFSGKIVDIHRPTADMFCIEDIAAGLSKICRFGGQCLYFYSVAQHSIIVAAMAPEEYKLEALMHDAAEAYLGDVIKPLKNIIGDSYCQVEERFEKAIQSAFNLKPDWYQVIKPIDNKVLELEAELLLFNNSDLWCERMEELELSTQLLRPELAYTEFINQYHEYKS